MGGFLSYIKNLVVLLRLKDSQRWWLSAYLSSLTLMKLAVCVDAISNKWKNILQQTAYAQATLCVHPLQRKGVYEALQWATHLYLIS